MSFLLLTPALRATTIPDWQIVMKDKILMSYISCEKQILIKIMKFLNIKEI
jgi:hypothetical protein